MESKDKYTNMILKYELKDRLDELEYYVNDLSSREFVSFTNQDDITSFFRDNVDKIYTDFNRDDIDNVRYYTGVAFREVNAVLRNNWSYDVNGILTPDRERLYRKLSSDIASVIRRRGNEIANNIIVYRGVSLGAFSRFGINSIQDLANLKGQYVYDSGFISTSLVRHNSFFNRPLEYHEPCNIEIKYLIPHECCDALPLITGDLSYNSEQQTEFLINNGSLSKVLDVELSSDKGKAFVTMAYIPKNVWNKGYRFNEEKVSL